MNIHIDLSSLNETCVTVIIIRSNRKEKILYHSGLQYFANKEARDIFVNTIKKEFGNINLEIYDVDIHQAHAPEDSDLKVRGKYWCPYCNGYHKFKNWGKQYKKCEICGMSDADFWVRKYNNLWTNSKIKIRKKKKVK